MRWPTTASSGNPGNATRAKFALTTARIGAAATSVASKARPASTGMPSAAKAFPETIRCCSANRCRSTGVPASGPDRMCVFHG